jgi:hypothetical protein
MKVTVRIVGIYWKSEVTFPDQLDQNVSVWAATQKAANESGGKLLLTGTSTIHEALHKVTAPVTDTPTGRVRGVGTYRLFEDRSVSQSASIWQYYIKRPTELADGSKALLTISIDNAAVPAIMARVQDGDVIFWRLLKIALSPENADLASRLA